jgi:hypothetical protein
VNLSDRPRLVRGLGGSIRFDTRLGREGESVDGTLRLDSWEGVVILA